MWPEQAILTLKVINELGVLVGGAGLVAAYWKDTLPSWSSWEGKLLRGGFITSGTAIGIVYFAEFFKGV